MTGGKGEGVCSFKRCGKTVFKPEVFVFCFLKSSVILDVDAFRQNQC